MADPGVSPAAGGSTVGRAVTDVKMPNDDMLNKMVDRSVNQAIKSRVSKLVKSEVDRVLGPYFKNMQVDIKPEIKDKVEDKKEEVKEIAPEGVKIDEGGDNTHD
jgi:hypothetical protein